MALVVVVVLVVVVCVASGHERSGGRDHILNACFFLLFVDLVAFSDPFFMYAHLFLFPPGTLSGGGRRAVQHRRQVSVR